MPVQVLDAVQHGFANNAHFAAKDYIMVEPSLFTTCRAVLGSEPSNPKSMHAEFRNHFRAATVLGANTIGPPGGVILDPQPGSSEHFARVKVAQP